MGFGYLARLCLCLLFAYALLIASARNTLLLSEDEEMVWGMKQGRSLRVSTNDYDQPTANRGHDPPSSSSSSRSGAGGRRRG